MANKQVKYAVVDAFTDSAFKGNPAAVCVLDEERDDTWLQLVAREFNLSETSYLTRIASDPNVNSSIPRFRLRWFTPVAEVDLCGHATLAASHYCFTSGLVNDKKVDFLTLSGILTAEKLAEVEKPSTGNKGLDNDTDLKFLIELNFPPVPLVDYNEEVLLISEALNGVPMIDLKRTAIGDDLLVVLPSAEAVVGFRPDSEKIRRCPGRGLIISALAPPGSEFDFFSRFFCPEMGIDEDPVCGSAHCALAVYWSKKLGKCDFLAYAASPRSGVVKLHVDEQNNRVKLQGKAVTVMEGSLIV